jgi:hypothetical protein
MNSEGLPDGIRIVLRFAKGRQIVLREGKFVSLKGGELSSLNDRLSQEPDIEISSLFFPSPEHQEAEGSEEQDPDLSLYYSIVLKDPIRAEVLANELNSLPFIEEAYVEPPTYLAVY